MATRLSTDNELDNVPSKSEDSQHKESHDGCNNMAEEDRADGKNHEDPDDIGLEASEVGNPDVNEKLKRSAADSVDTNHKKSQATSDDNKPLFTVVREQISKLPLIGPVIGPVIAPAVGMIPSMKSPSEPAKKKRTWKQKAISQWDNQDVMDWINSLTSSNRYCPEKFPKSFDGKQLLEIKEGDLSFAIGSAMYRKIFMKQVASAQRDYETPPKLDEEGYKNDDNDEKDDAKQESAPVAGSGVVGLANQGNTCYMNTSIQILSQSAYITAYLQKRAKWLKKRDKYPMLNNWTDLCDKIYNQPGKLNKTITPSGIKKALQRLDSDFGSGAQDDSARALVYMLQELDKEIDNEIDADVIPKNCICLKAGSTLSPEDIKKYVARLLDEHNPAQLSSVLKKTFDGIELISCECLECNRVYQTFAVFRVITLPVKSQRVKLENIHVVYNNKYHKFPEISVLGHCSVDVLRYHAMKKFSQSQSKSKLIKCDIICVSPKGRVKNIIDDTISDLESMTGIIFVLINTKRKLENETNYMLQLGLCVNKDTSQISSHTSISYTKYNQNSIYQLVKKEFTDQLASDDDEKYDHYINYNGKVFSMDELELFGIESNMHNEDVNILLLLRVNPNCDQYCYDYRHIDEKLLGEAEDEYPGSSLLDAVTKYKKKKIEHKKNHKKRGRFSRVKAAVDKELDRIEQTIKVLKVKQHIHIITSKYLLEMTKVAVSPHGSLTSLAECFTEYQQPQILDQSTYEHACPCKKGAGNSDLIQYRKEIVYSPPIFLFHLDRYGENMSDNYATSSYDSAKSYYKGQQVAVKYRNNNFYAAQIVHINRDKMKVKFDSNGKVFEVRKSNWSSKVYPASNSNIHYGGCYGGGVYNDRGNNKFDHDIHFNMKFACDKRYSLYGVSNHTGTTKTGHYSAIVRCLTDKKWYDISDSSVMPFNPPSITKHSASATILAYVRKQEKI